MLGCKEIVRRKTYSVWLLVRTRTNRLPYGGATAEIPESLRHLQRLYDNSLLLLVISDLCVSSHREVFPQWVAIEAVVGHDAPQVRMADKKDAEEIIYLPLVPVCAVI